jgi:hypothetical protein
MTENTENYMHHYIKQFIQSINLKLVQNLLLWWMFKQNPCLGPDFSVVCLQPEFIMWALHVVVESITQDALCSDCGVLTKGS